MCGIVGFIGRSKNQKVCFDFTTALLKHTEIRGDDATGFWASSLRLNGNKESGKVYFTKAPKKSTEFVNEPFWKHWKNDSPSLFLGHCRRSTKKGSEAVNKNNHPFVSEDYRTALVHNGNVPEHNTLRSSFDLKTDCDSEVLLRIIEQGSLYKPDYIKSQIGELSISQEDNPLLFKDMPNGLFKDIPDDKIPFWAYRLMGLIDVFALINYAAMSVAVAEEWQDGTHALWVFRNDQRPLHLVDMTETLGQVYISSERQIIRKAFDDTPELQNILGSTPTPVIELPANNDIWLIVCSPNGELSHLQFEINKTKKYDTTFEAERPADKEVLKPRLRPSVVSNLNLDTFESNVIQKKNPTASKTA